MENFELGPKNNDLPKKEYSLDGYKVSIKERKVIEEPDSVSEIGWLKDMVRDIANSPDLKVINSEGEQLFSTEYDKVKSSWLTSEKIKELSFDKTDLLRALEQNMYSRWHQTEAVLNILRDMEMSKTKVSKWREEFKYIESLNNLEEKILKLDNLLIDIYKNI